MAINDIYQVVTTGDYLGQAFSNIWWYQATAAGVGVGAVQLGDQFEAQVWDQVIEIMDEGVTNCQQQVVCYADLDDNYSQGLEDGVVISANTELPSFFASGFRCAWPGPGRRRAYKRIPGVTEAMIEGNAIASTWVAQFTGTANRMSLTLSAGGWSFNPVVVGSDRVYGTNPTVKGAATGWAWYAWTTQNSRKP